MRPAASVTRRGFTLIELLVVIAILGMLMALLLPAIGAVRERAKRTVCSTHMNQISLALQTYHSQNNCFPPGVGSCTPATGKQWDLAPPCQGPNWLAKLLAQLDEEAYFNQMMKCIDINANPCVSCTTADSANRWQAVGTTVPPPFACPSAETIDVDSYYTNGSTLKNLAKGNIAGNFGADYYVGHKGMFDIQTLDKTFTSTTDAGAKGKWKAGGKGIRVDDVHDGATTTLIIGEILARNNSADIRGAWFLPNMGASSFTGYLPPNANPASKPATGFPVSTLGTTYKAANYYDTIQGCDKNIASPNINKMYCGGSSSAGAAGDSATPGSYYAALRSAHPGGVNVAMVGHNVAFISDTIDSDVFMALCTRDGKATGNLVEIKAAVPD